MHDKKIEAKVSIIIPVYNVEHYIDNCIDSVVNQSYKNIEIILVDDGSTDGSRKACEIWRDFDNRIILLSKKNGGLSSARNFGLDRATGDYICFVDSDDWLHPSYVQKLLAAALRTGAPVVCCGVNIIHGRSVDPHSAIHDISYINKQHVISPRNPIIYRFFPSAWNKIYKSEIITNVRFVEGEYYEDHKFFLSVLQNVESIMYIPDHLYYYRSGRNGQITSDGGRKVLDIFDVILRIKQATAYNSTSSKRHLNEVSKYVYRLLWERLLVVNDSTKNEFKKMANEICGDIIANSDSSRDSFIPRFISDFFNDITTYTVYVVVKRKHPRERMIKTLRALALQKLKSLDVVVLSSSEIRKEDFDFEKNNIRFLKIPFLFEPFSKFVLMHAIREKQFDVIKAGAYPGPWHYYDIVRNIERGK